MTMFSERLRMARRLKGWSLSQAAKAAKMGKMTWCRYELGERFPDSGRLAAIAQSLGLDVKALLQPESSRTVQFPNAYIRKRAMERAMAQREADTLAEK